MNQKNARLQAGCTRLMMCLVLAGSFVFGRAQAQAIVSDPIHTQLTMSGWIEGLYAQGQQYAKQIAQYQTQINQYKTQIQQYQQMYVKGTAYKAMPGFRENIEQQFPQRDINQYVEESCGTAAKENPVGAAQRAYCVAIIQTQNRHYNAIRALLKDVAKNDADLAAASAERGLIQPEDQGALQANTNKIASINSKMQNDVQNAKYTMDAYNAALATLNDEVVRSANAAFNNKNSLLGTAVQGATLHLALKAARLRDR